MQAEKIKKEEQVLIVARKNESKEKTVEGNTEKFSSEITITDSDIPYFDGKILFFETHKMGYGYAPNGIIIVEYDNRNSSWDIRLFLKPELDDILLFSESDSLIVSSEEEITEGIKFMIEKEFRETSYRVRDLTQGQNWYRSKEEIRKWLWEFYKKCVFDSELDYEFGEKFSQTVNSEIVKMHKSGCGIQSWEDLLAQCYKYAYLTYHGNRK